MTFVCQPARSAAPHTPRIVLLGATGSGKGLMAALLARKYRIINANCGLLLKEAVAVNTSTGQACKSFIESGIPVPDALVLEVLKDRLSQLDASSNGWVLHGYPLTLQQAEQLSDAGYVPNRVISLDISADSITERLAPRAVDPITGERYHLLYNPPRTREVKDRLKFNPKDSNAEIEKRVTNYRVYIDDIFQYYSDIVQRVNADQEAHSVFEAIESIIVNPLPKSKPSPSVESHGSTN